MRTLRPPPGDTTAPRPAVPPTAPPAPPSVAPSAPPATAPAYDAGDYLGMLRRSWWLLLAAVVLGLAGAVTVTALQTPVYGATTSVLVLPTGVQNVELAGDRTRNGQINLDTEAQLVRSTGTAELARTLLRARRPAAELREAVSVTVPPNTAVLEVTYAAGDPAAARAGSQAFAEAYLKNRRDSTEAELDRQIEALQKQVEGVRKQLRDVTAKLNSPVGQPSSSYLAAQQQNLSAQLNTLTTRQGELRATPLAGGRIISDAQLPTGPSRPVLPLNLAAGLMLGLVLGVAGVLGRQFLDRRVHRGADVVRRAGVPLLVELPDRTMAGSATTADATFGAFTPAGRLFSRLRNEVAASLDRVPAVVVVTGACRGPAAPALAANLAIGFTRAGNSVALVYADVTGAWGEAGGGHFGVAVSPGLSDVLAGRVALDEALTAAASHPGLQVLPTGSTASAAGLLRSDAVRRVLTALKTQVEYVIVHAPSTAESADAQSLAIHADAVILAVDLRRTTDLEVADAAEQLHRVGTPLLGAVAVAPSVPNPTRTGTEPAPTTTPDDSPTTDARREGSALVTDSPTLVLPRIKTDADNSATAEADAVTADTDTAGRDGTEADQPDTDQVDADRAGDAPEPAPAAAKGRR